MTRLAKLPIDDMDQRHPGLTRPIAASNLEAASVCLHRHHVSPVQFDLRTGDEHSAVSVDWRQPDARVQKAWANDTDATEAGACALVLAAVERTEGLVAIGRAETMTGADYYVAPEGSKADDLEDCLRLEVSGVDRGSEALVERRLSDKLVQAGRGVSDLPAMAGVAGFKARLIRLAHLVSRP